jgi:hypothetical protein
VGSTTSSGHIIIDHGAFLTIGDTNNDAIGSASNFTLATSGIGQVSLTGTIHFDLYDNANDGGLNSTSSNDLLTLHSDQTVVLGGTLNVANLTDSDPTTWMLNSAWQLIDWSGVSAPVRRVGTFDNLVLPDLDSVLTGLVWDTSILYTNGIITIVPKPSRLLLMMSGCAALITRRRRLTTRC